MSYYSRLISTPIGKMIAKCDDFAIIYLDFVDEEEIEEINPKYPILLQLEEELDEYFAKKRRYFTLALSPKGTAFQKGVWDALLKIPYASRISYADEAKIFGNPKAVRAVANANSKNPISIIIPCHRVISSSGALGGYSGGLWRKEFLLSLERE